MNKAPNGMEYLSIEECKPGFLYEIRGRNGSVGIYRVIPQDEARRQQFCHVFDLSRHKFGSNYVFGEYHYDDGEPYGTVFPLRELEQVPPEVLTGSEAHKLKYLNEWEDKLRAQEAQQTNQEADGGVETPPA